MLDHYYCQLWGIWVTTAVYEMRARLFLNLFCAVWSADDVGSLLINGVTLNLIRVQDLCEEKTRL